MPNQQAADQFLMMNAKFFSNDQIPFLDQEIKNMTPEQFRRVQYLNFKDPTICLLVSIFGGSFGIDRFLVGDVTLGIVKLLTCGGLGVWHIIDCFLIMGIARDKNIQEFQRASSFGYGAPAYSSETDQTTILPPRNDNFGNQPPTPPTNNF